MPAEQSAHRVGQRADAEFEHRAVRDERQGVARYGELELAGRAERRHGGSTIGFDYEIEVRPGKQALGVGPRHLRIHFRDERTADVERRHQIIGRKPEAVLATRIGWTHLE